MAVPGARLFTNEINHAISKASRSMRPLIIMDALRKEIEHWRFLNTWEGHLPWLEDEHSHIVLCTDASPFGWGGVLSPDSICLLTSDYWTEEHKGLSINVKEARAGTFSR